MKRDSHRPLRVDERGDTRRYTRVDFRERSGRLLVDDQRVTRIDDRDTHVIVHIDVYAHRGRLAAGSDAMRAHVEQAEAVPRIAIWFAADALGTLNRITIV
jgi:hypothetical protein